MKKVLSTFVLLGAATFACAQVQINGPVLIGPSVGGTISPSTSGYVAFYTGTTTIGGLSPAAALNALGGISGLTQDVTASGPGSVAATVVGINGVPICAGFSPVNGQTLQYTTVSSPNPCYTVVTFNIPFVSGNISSVFNSATATPNSIVNLTGGASGPYTASSQLTVAGNNVIVNWNGACIETTYASGPSILVSGDYDTFNQPCLIPDAAIHYAAIDDTGWGFTINGGGVWNLSGNAPKSGQYWYWNLEYVSDELATLNSWNAQGNFPIFGNSGAGAQGTLRCDSTFCGSALYNPAGSGSSAILTVNGAALSVGCSGNGIDWEGTNALNLNNVTIQSYNQFAIKANHTAQGAGKISLLGFYDASTTCPSGSSQWTAGNPAFNNMQISTPIVAGSQVIVTNHGATLSNGISSFFPTTCSSGCTDTIGYYVIVRAAGSQAKSTIPLLIGDSAAVNPAWTGSSVTVLSPTSPGSGDTCDFLAVDQSLTGNSQTGPVPYSTNTYAITGEQNVLCDGSVGNANYVTFSDTGLRGSYTFYGIPAPSNQNSPPTPYSVALGTNGWNQTSIILTGDNTGHATYEGTCPIGLNVMIPDYGGDIGNQYITCTNPIEDNFIGGPVGNSPALVSRPTGGTNYVTSTPSAIINPMWWKYTPTGLKGIYNLSAQNSGWPFAGGPTDAITVVDSCPFCTLAQKGNRPSWNAADAAIGIDYSSSGLYLRDPLHIHSYIDTVGDDTSFLETLDATHKYFFPPTTVWNSLKVTQVTGTPTIGTIAAFTSGGGLAASTEYFYVIVGTNAEGNTVNSAEKNVTTGTCTSGSNCRVAFIISSLPTGATGYDVYRSTSTGTEVGPCNGTNGTNGVVAVGSGHVPSFTTTFVDYGNACGATSYPSSSTMPAASITAAGPGATIGYGTGSGAGCAITQITSRTTGVTCDAATGAITLYTAAGSATPATFTVTDTSVATTDVPSCAQKSGTNLYQCVVTAVGSGSFNITFFTTGGTSSDAPVLNFTVMKGSAN